MKAIRAIYDGNIIKPLERVTAPANTQVIATFLDSQVSPEEQSLLWTLAGSWEDDRSTDEIIREIYESRGSSTEDINL